MEEPAIAERTGEPSTDELIGESCDSESFRAEGELVAEVLECDLWLSVRAEELREERIGDSGAECEWSLEPEVDEVDLTDGEETPPPAEDPSCSEEAELSNSL